MNNLNSQIETRQADGSSNTTVTRRFCVVFLDIDGVLNTSQTIMKRDEFGHLFCPKAVARLEKLCEATGAKIVVSSTWRKNKGGLNWLQTLFQMRNIDVDVIDITPDLCRKTESGLWMSAIRGEEIADWLRNNEVDAYVILDDDRDMLDEQLPFFVRTNFEDGFNEQCFKSALKILLPASNGV